MVGDDTCSNHEHNLNTVQNKTYTLLNIYKVFSMEPFSGDSKECFYCIDADLFERKRRSILNIKSDDHIHFDDD
jgi:hypothetical protein